MEFLRLFAAKIAKLRVEMGGVSDALLFLILSTLRKIHKDTFLLMFFSLVRKERKGQKEERFDSRLGDADTHASHMCQSPFSGRADNACTNLLGYLV